MQHFSTNSKTTNVIDLFSRQVIQHHSNPSLCPNHWCWRSWSWPALWRPTTPSGTPKKDVLFIIGDWNAKLGSQDIPRITGKYGLGVQNEVEQRLTEFCQESMLAIANTLFQQYNRWLGLFFATKIGGALYSQQKQDLELTVAQIVSSLLQKPDLNRRK